MDAIIHILAIIGGLAVIGAIPVAYWIIKAPYGYEDDDGFHYGEKQK